MKLPRVGIVVASIFLAVIGGTAAGFWVEKHEPQQGQAQTETQNKSKADTANILASDRVAYYTKVLAIFTGALTAFGVVQIIFLVLADNTSDKSATAALRAAEAASLQAQSMIAAASPRLLMVDKKMVKYLRRSVFEDPAQSLEGELRPLVLVHNGGGARMLLSRLCIQCCVADALPEQPVYETIRGVNHPIAEGESLWLIDETTTFRLSEEERGNVEVDYTRLWVFGFFSYLNHVTDETITHGFVMRWAPWDDVLIAEGPPNYSYQKKERAGLSQPR